MLSQQKRGVMMENPLYSKVQQKNIVTFRPRDFLEEHASFVAKIALVICSVLFVGVPLIVIFNTEFSPKQRWFSLLFFAGIVQPALIRQLVSEKFSSKKHQMVQMAYYILMLNIISLIALYSDPEIMPSRVDNSSDTIPGYLHNCSLLENIPPHLKTEPPNKMLYHKGGELPLVDCWRRR